ncbi:MAG TPA: ClpX C4-type zinc finger protein [Candidatus Eisenbacteria bacterium]|nr:ClpX C4-type zinc finger protein [Candidatus Eisenbacteria bacterium]
MAAPEPSGDLVPIGRFAKLAGLSVPQLRHYDRRGILLPAARDRRSGYRYYSEAQAAAARVIALLRSIDVPLADVQELLVAPQPERVRRVFAEHRQRVERRLEEARAALESIDRIIREGELMEAATGDRCSFCDLPASERPARLTTGAGARICGLCVELALEVLEIDAREPQRRQPPPDGGEARTGWLACAFCGRRSTEVHKLVAGPSIAICDGCLHGIAHAT